MSKIASKVINFSVNSVAIEDELNNISQEVKQELAEVAGFSSSGPERVVGNYDWSYKMDGSFDGAASQGDATIWALIGSAGVATAFDPTGASNDADNPNFDSTAAVLESYTISGSVGGAVTYSATLQGASALVASRA